MKVDIHCHSNQHSSASRISPKDLVQMAEAAGYDAIFMTNRGKVWSSRELAALNEMCERVRTPGNRIITAWGAGPAGPRRRQRGISSPCPRRAKCSRKPAPTAT